MRNERAFLVLLSSTQSLPSSLLLPKAKANKSKQGWVNKHTTKRRKNFSSLLLPHLITHAAADKACVFTICQVPLPLPHFRAGEKAGFLLSLSLEPITVKRVFSSSLRSDRRRMWQFSRFMRVWHGITLRPWGVNAEP